VKKIIGTAAILGALAAPAIVLAAPSGADASGYCGASANGCQAASDAGAQNGSGAASGAFGAFGTFGSGPHDFGHLTSPTDTAKGADGTQTGLNNSAVAGNRQGNLP
jgi:hypothetical protein